MMTLVVATHNTHKLDEIKLTLGALLGPGIELVATDGPEPVEDGTTFEENALIKAREAFRHSGQPSLADDSGICVDALDGAPGIFSSRFSDDGTDAANVALLLDKMKGMKERSARFVCAVAFVSKDGERVVQAEWPGVIRAAAKGKDGFGYDPIFAPAGFTRTAAELTSLEKAAFSHRARALGLIAPTINRYAQSLG